MTPLHPLPAALLLALAQAPSPAPSASGEYLVGAGDVLDVAVLGNDELTRTATVQTSGAVTLPLLGEVVVAGLSVPEIQRKLATLLERDYLVDPKVEVKIREYQSQFVIVMGEVNSPGRKALRGKTALIDMLIDAGGLKPSASGEIEITRREGSFTGGGDTLRLKLSANASMSPQDRINLEVVLRNGDLINVAQKQQVTIEGEVARPGRYTIEGDTTLTAAISLAGGLTRFGSDDVKVRRLDIKSGKAEILDVDLKAVRNGRKPDVTLLPNDVVTVPRRRF